MVCSFLLTPTLLSMLVNSNKCNNIYDETELSTIFSHATFYSSAGTTRWSTDTDGSKNQRLTQLLVLWTDFTDTPDA